MRKLLLQRAVLVLSTAVFYSHIALAADSSIVLTYGANSEARFGSVGIQKQVEPFAFLRSPNVTTSLECSLGYWHGIASNKENNNLIDAAVLPSVKYFPGNAVDGRFYVEGGIGAHLLSRTRINNDRRFGSAFQFGDLVGMGWRLGQEKNYEIGLRLQHISNGGIKKPNQGINFLELRFVIPI